MVRYAKISSIALVRACANSKNEKAWAEFIRRFHPIIAAAVLRTARQFGETSRALADDLVQDTYLKLCEDKCRLLAEFQPKHEEAIYGYLAVLAIHVAHDYFKSARAAKRGAGLTEPIREASQTDPGTIGSHSFDEPIKRLQIDQIYKILKQVTAGKDQEKKRAIFWLRHQFGFTASEIAAIPSIGLTTEGVESVLMRLAALIRGQFLTLVLAMK
jgi:RNA polymerase sigma-70 factor (ECF subfamily)